MREELLKIKTSEGHTVCLDELGYTWSSYHVFLTYCDINSQIQEEIFLVF